MFPYSPELIKRGLKNPRLILKELGRWEKRLYSNLYTRNHGEGVDIMSQDWDNLIILDACRFDYFTSCNSLDGDRQYRISKSSTSKTFMKEHFVGERHHDTVMVSGNAYIRLIEDDGLHDIIPVEINPIREMAEFESHKPDNCQLPEDSYAVLPEDMVRETVEANQKYPNKRLVSHFMQPHLPFLGPTGLELHQRMLDKADEISGQRQRWGDIGLKLYDYVDGDQLTLREVETAYTENVELVLEYVAELVDQLDGKTVISADHGELLGDRLTPLSKRRFGHPGEVRCEELCKVPWHVVDGNRRRIVEEPPSNLDRMSEDEVEEKLRVLGYV